MTKTTLILTAACAAFLLTPIAATAGDAPKISYAAKKQGLVHFKDKTAAEAPAAAEQDQTSSLENTNPADIEPAAGGYEPEERDEENKLSESIRLPRKN